MVDSAVSGELDKTDLKILRLLQSDGRMGNAEIAKRVNTSAATCHRRTQRLFVAGYISAVRAQIVPHKVGRGTLVIVGVVLDRSTPESFERSHLPLVSEACACGTLRASASSKAIVCSAAVTTFESGALATTIPRLVASGTSTLSTPTPARPIARSFVPAASSSASSLVAERIKTPSNSPSRALT